MSSLSVSNFYPRRYAPPNRPDPSSFHGAERSIFELGQTTIRRAFCFFTVLLSALRHSKAFCLVASNVGIGDNIDPYPLH
jgi:hypothetical protein